jgi:hypothetical protein
MNARYRDIVECAACGKKGMLLSVVGGKGFAYEGAIS